MIRRNFLPILLGVFWKPKEPVQVEYPFVPLTVALVYRCHTCNAPWAAHWRKDRWTWKTSRGETALGSKHNGERPLPRGWTYSAERWFCPLHDIKVQGGEHGRTVYFEGPNGHDTKSRIKLWSVSGSLS